MNRAIRFAAIPLIAVLASVLASFSPSTAIAAGCQSGTLIKGTLPAVYFCGADGKRYVFTNDKGYFTWYTDFSGVKTVTDAELAAVQIGGNVTYRPGTRMVKIQSDPSVYAISKGGLLRHIGSESVASCLFGADWNRVIDDISDAFFVNYKMGPDIVSCTDYDTSGEREGARTINDDRSISASSPATPPSPETPSSSATSTPMTPFALSAVAPTDGSLNVAFETLVTASFSAPLKASTVSAVSLTLKRGMILEKGTVSASGTAMTFTPDALLLPSTTYVATLAAGVTDTAGRSLAEAKSWTFTTASPPSNPYVTATSPKDGATGVILNGKITANFSEDMSPTSVSSRTFTLKKGTTSIGGKVTYSGGVATFTPNGSLGTRTTYTATITTDAVDTLTNGLLAPKVWTFTTGDAAGGAPSVKTVTPANGAHEVPVTAAITAAFSEGMSASTVNASTFTLAQEGTMIAGTVTYADRVATFKPSAPLARNASYTATVTADAKDTDGHQIPSNVTWTFVTTP